MPMQQLIGSARAVRPWLSVVIAGLAFAACHSAATPSSPKSATKPKSTAKVSPAAELVSTTAGYTWQPSTHSPDGVQPEPALRDLAKRCQRFERGLMQVAAQVAQRQAQHQDAFAPEELKLALRAAGVPQVWERVWSLNATQLQDEDAARRIDAWLSKHEPQGEVRCGIAKVKGPDLESLVVIALDALGDLTAIPTRVRLGQWISVDAQLHLPTSDAKVVVMGPTGAPRAVLTSAPRNNRVLSRVALDQPGPWLIQVISVHGQGPRPTLEAMVFVDSEPPSHFEPHPAPGEAAGHGFADATTALLRMTNDARAHSGLNALQRDSELDRLANEHVRAMVQARQLAHDLGRGGPAERVTQAGLQPLAVGENLATASTLINAHRALWASPSHRGAMLEPRFTAMGIGIVTSEDRSIWVCELFANFGSTGKIAPTH
jgi:uncharacterized protein YkwD